MKILFFAPMHSIHSKRWIAYAATRGHDVHVVYPSFPDTPLSLDWANLGNISFHAIQFRKRELTLEYVKRLLGLMGRLKNLVRSIDPDLIHVHWVDIWAYLFSRINRHPFIITAWGSDILIAPQKSIIHRLLAMFAMRKADTITCDAAHLKQAICKLNVPPDRVKIIFFGTDLTKFNPAKKDVTLRRDLAFDEDAKLIISLRALNPVYDVGTFVRAVPRVLKDIRTARFIVVGDGTEKQSLIALAGELGVSDNVRFVGRLPDEQLQRYTASADVYVSTSLSDGGLAASTAEAMASGVPVIITNFGNNAEWVEDRKNGLLFERKDHNALAERIVYLLTHPEESARMAKLGRQTIDERNNWHKEMQKVEDLYRKLVSRGTALSAQERA
jgi:glycosyltransferase involved in cell wall biosynthesis